MQSYKTVSSSVLGDTATAAPAQSIPKWDFASLAKGALRVAESAASGSQTPVGPPSDAVRHVASVVDQLARPINRQADSWFSYGAPSVGDSLAYGGSSSYAPVVLLLMSVLALRSWRRRNDNRGAAKSNLTSSSESSTQTTSRSQENAQGSSSVNEISRVDSWSWQSVLLSPLELLAQGALVARVVGPWIPAMGQSVFGIAQRLWLLFTASVFVSAASEKVATSFFTKATAAIFTLRLAVIFVCGLLACSVIGLDVSMVLTRSGSAFTVALAYLTKEIWTNVAAGAALVYLAPFSVGDRIISQGKEGFVQSVGPYYTTLKTIDNKVIYVPNSKLLGVDVVNVSAMRLDAADADTDTSV